MVSHCAKIIAFFMFFLVSACQAPGLLYLGGQVEPETVVHFSAKEQEQERWQDLYLDIDCLLQRSDSDLSIEGTVGFANHPQIMYARVQYLKVTLFLLDKDRRVVSYRQIMNSAWIDPQDRISFQRKLQLPEEAVAYTFGYEAEFVEGEPDVGRSSVWKLPRMKR